MASPATGNRILDSLSPAEFSIVEPLLEACRVTRGAVLTDAGHPAAHVYFPIDCVLALVGATEGGASVEIAVVGSEGMASVSAALGGQRAPFRLIAQIEGRAWRLATSIVTRRLSGCRELQAALLAYSHAVIAEIGQSAICNRFHNARQRLARWLLITTDRAGTRELHLTHEFMSHMVGGPRSAVSEAASALRESGAIDYRRGLLSIRDPSRLREEACECYEAITASHRR